MSPVIILNAISAANAAADTSVDHDLLTTPIPQDITDDAESSEEEYSYIQFAEREQERSRRKEEKGPSGQRWLSMIDNAIPDKSSNGFSGLNEDGWGGEQGVQEEQFGQQDQEQRTKAEQGDTQVEHGVASEDSKRGGDRHGARRRSAAQLEERGGDVADGTRLLGVCVCVWERKRMTVCACTFVLENHCTCAHCSTKALNLNRKHEFAQRWCSVWRSNELASNSALKAK